MAHPKAATLAQMKSAGAFAPFIDYIRFPRYRNLEENARITFDFPVTVFVGQNGCGKSSALQALYGCPYGKGVGDYWFNTHTDPIVETANDRNCLIYSYNSGGEASEVLKTRINKKDRLDLWDTSEPLKKYGMTAPGRVEPVRMNVVYLNFRAGQSAFDKAFFGEVPPETGIQDFLRYRSHYLERIRGGATKLRRFDGKVFDPVVRLGADELKVVSDVLGREYKSAVMIRHRLFGKAREGMWGYSVFFETAHAKYSEAFAGSGETNVALLVHEIYSAPANSLVLLDEPETSLHPGAQSRIIDFVIEQTVRKRHQVVVCTHAKAIVESFPSAAVKVFSPTATGKFRVLGNVMPAEAFHFIGQPVENKKCVVVEDRLAKAMIDKLLVSSPATAALLDVQYYPGGESGMKRDAVIYSRDAAPKILLLDGDSRRVSEAFNPDNLTVVQMGDIPGTTALLDEKIKEATGAKIEFALDGGSEGGNLAQKLDLQRGFLKYFRKCVFFLPFTNPETELWDDAVARAWLQLNVSVGNVETVLAEVVALEPKKRYARLAELTADRSRAEDLSFVHASFVKAWAANATRTGPVLALLEQIKLV